MSGTYLVFWKLGDPPQEMTEGQWDQTQGVPPLWREPDGQWINDKWQFLSIEDLPPDVRLWALIS